MLKYSKIFLTAHIKCFIELSPNLITLLKIYMTLLLDSMLYIYLLLHKDNYPVTMNILNKAQDRY